MIIKYHTPLIKRGSFSSSPELLSILRIIYQSIRLTEWPDGSGKFLIYPESGKKHGMGSGVKPIKSKFINNLKNNGWDLESKPNIASLITPGPIDATYRVGDKLFAIEWETGNISSSHRALNKMALGILKGVLIGGVLILPTRNMAQYLTDRVGNYPELEPYFPLWQSIVCDEGYLAVIGIEHDDISLNVPKIPKATDGRALR